MIGARVVAIDGAQALQDLQRLGVELKQPQEGMMIAARAVDNSLKKHFRQKNQAPNDRGFTKQNFWGQIRESVVTLKDGNDSAIVQINDPRINPHIFGAVITPKRAKALAIPVVNEAYGLRPATFDNLVAIKTGKKSAGGRAIGVLAKVNPGSKILQVMYVLVKRTIIKADPTALPTDEELQAAAGKAFESWLNRKLAKQRG